VRTWRAEVVQRYPHPGRAFTQGLITGTGAAREIAVWESAGGYGTSALCRYRLGNVQPQRCAALPPDLFGDGICRIGAGAHLWQLTWRERVALRWDARTLELLDRVPYNREGWGICAADGYLLTSDGSSELVRRDPDTLGPLGVIQVRHGADRVRGLNDLAWAGGLVWANVAGTELIVGIDQESGQVTDVVDATAARERRLGDPQAIMNGIAVLPGPGEFLLTGKTWRAVCHVRLVPARLRDRRLAAIRGGWSQ
jgi:glutaminyl-peptide cyclotransferase